MAIFLHSKQQKTYQLTLGTQEPSPNVAIRANMAITYITCIKAITTIIVILVIINVVSYKAHVI